MRPTSILKYGTCLAIFRLTLLWFIVDVAHNSSGWPQVVAYLLQIGLMFPEVIIARDARNNFSLWTTEMIYLLILCSYLYFLLLWIITYLLQKLVPADAK